MTMPTYRAGDTYSHAAASYLNVLAGRVAALPDGHDIVTGVAEELAGLDGAQTRARIAEIGEPWDVAAAAHSESAMPTPSRAAVLLPTLTMIFGGAIVPVLGAIVGMVLVATSTAWTRREKLVALIAPTAITALVWLIGWSVGGTVASPAAEHNPLMPAAYDLAWTSVVLWVLLTAVSGLVLLIIGERRRR